MGRGRGSVRIGRLRRVPQDPSRGGDRRHRERLAARDRGRQRAGYVATARGPLEITGVREQEKADGRTVTIALEVESGPLKAMAAYRADQGDYAVTDPALLKALAAHGEHGMFEAEM